MQKSETHCVSVFGQTRGLKGKLINAMIEAGRCCEEPKFSISPNEKDLMRFYRDRILITLKFAKFTEKLFGSSIDQLIGSNTILFVYWEYDNASVQNWLIRHIKKAQKRFPSATIIAVEAKCQDVLRSEKSSIGEFCLQNGFDHFRVSLSWDTSKLLEHIAGLAWSHANKSQNIFAT